MLAFLGGRLLRPRGRLAYTYTPAGRGPVESAAPRKVPPGSALRNCGFVPKPCFCGLSARLSASPLKTLRVFRRLPGPDRDRAWHLWSSSSRGECPRPRYRSTRRCSRVFRSPFASRCRVAGIPAPCLTRVCRRNPRTASPRVTPLSARPLSPLPHYMLNPFKPSQQPQSNTYRKTMRQTLSDPITNNWKRAMHIARLHSSAYGLAGICSKN